MGGDRSPHVGHELPGQVDGVLLPQFQGRQEHLPVRVREGDRRGRPERLPFLPAVAVAWTLRFPGATGAIVGARSPRQVQGWLPAAALKLKEDDLADIAAPPLLMIAKTGAAARVAALAGTRAAVAVLTPLGVAAPCRSATRAAGAGSTTPSAALRAWRPRQ